MARDTDSAATAGESAADDEAADRELPLADYQGHGEFLLAAVVEDERSVTDLLYELGGEFDPDERRRYQGEGREEKVLLQPTETGLFAIRYTDEGIELYKELDRG